MNLIMDTMVMVLARLRQGGRNEARGGGWSLWSNSLAIFE